MPILSEFAYFRPATLAQALKLLARHKRPAVLAGGTDLLNLLKEGGADPDALIDIKGIGALAGVSFARGRLRIGALATFAELLESREVERRFPLVAETARAVGSPGVRNRATLAGNICSAVPCLDSGPLLLAYDAVVSTAGPAGKREIPIAKWFRAPRRTALRRGELVVAVTLPLPKEKHAGCFVKLGRYAGEDLAQASVLAMALEGGRFRVAFGSVAPVPLRAPRIEALLSSRPLDDRLIAEAQRLVAAAIAPISDLRATREYRLHMCRVMLERALRAAASRLAGLGPRYGEKLI